MEKTLVLYVFHEFNNRVQHFIDHAIFFDENIDFIMISNGDNTFEVPDYVTKIYRENIGFDFGGWSDALLKDNLYQKYTKFIFVNSSVMGPYIPLYYKDNWTTIFLNGLQNNVKLFGCTINPMGNPLQSSHIQSYTFSMDISTLQYLIDCDIFSTTNYSETYSNTILFKEILMSRKIIEKGWNIGCLQPNYKDVDFTFKDKSPYEYGNIFYNDPTNLCHKNILWNEYQLVFIKGNKN